MGSLTSTRFDSPGFEYAVRLRGTSTDWDILADQLRSLLSQPVAAQPVAEIRTPLEGEWTLIFWKLGQGSTRLFAAHPEPHEWVATLMVEAEVLELLISQLKRPFERVTLRHLVQQQGRLGAFSNLEIEFCNASSENSSSDAGGMHKGIRKGIQ